MSLNPHQLPVPDSYATDLFVLRRQMASDNASDFDAVMSSRDKLRVWSDSDWPQDAFSLEENGADLDMHIAEHERDEAYCFSILSADQGTLLGSLYLNPVAPLMEDYTVDPEAQALLAQFDARADYWLREGVSPETEVVFIQSIQAWLHDTWWFRRFAFCSRRAMVEQRRRYAEAGLIEIAVLTARSGARRCHLHAAQGDRPSAGR